MKISDQESHQSCPLVLNPNCLVHREYLLSLLSLALIIKLMSCEVVSCSESRLELIARFQSLSLHFV